MAVFTRRFSTVTDRFSGSWCRLPESRWKDGGNGEKTGKKRAKMGEKWPKKSWGRWQSLLCGVGTSVRGWVTRRRRISSYTTCAPTEGTLLLLGPPPCCSGGYVCLFLAAAAAAEPSASATAAAAATAAGAMNHHLHAMAAPVPHTPCCPCWSLRVEGAQAGMPEQTCPPCHAGLVEARAAAPALAAMVGR